MDTTRMFVATEICPSATPPNVLPPYERRDESGRPDRPSRPKKDWRLALFFLAVLIVVCGLVATIAQGSSSPNADHQRSQAATACLPATLWRGICLKTP